MSKTNTAIDFAALDVGPAHERGIEVQIKHPVTKAPLDAFITVRGDESPTVMNWQRSQYNKDQRAKKDEPKTLEQLEAWIVDKLITATISWRGVGWGAEAEIECTPENMRKIYANKRIREQLLEAMGEEANFPLA